MWLEKNNKTYHKNERKYEEEKIETNILKNTTSSEISKILDTIKKLLTNLFIEQSNKFFS